ncbi:MAG: hypothetical protein J6R10_02655 [Tidjanibacter sp.]|nr:hypothetical protein [Tidjanibacter sp.]
MELITILVWIACGFGCYKLAERQGRNVTIAAVLGVLLGVFAVLGYLIAGDKK